MASYWPTPAAEQDDPKVAARMNGLPKLVVSRTLQEVTWANTLLLLGDDVAGELAKLKQQPGKDMVIMGSSDLTRTADERIGLKLLWARPFDSGNVLLTYQPADRQLPS